jgi:hypothetical protein
VINVAAGAARPHSRQQSRVLARNAPLIDSDSDDDDYIPAYLVQSSESEESLIADSEEEQLNRRDRRQAQGRGIRTTNRNVGNNNHNASLRANAATANNRN